MSETCPSPSSSGADPSKYPSLDIVFDLTKERLAGQSSLADAIDNKANFVFGAASVLIGTAVAFQAVTPLAPHLSLGDKLVRVGILLPVAIAYSITASFARGALAVRAYDIVPTPAELYKYLEIPIVQTKGEVTRAMREAYESNERRLKAKATDVKRAMWALMIEVAVLVVSLAIQVLLS